MDSSIIWQKKGSWRLRIKTAVLPDGTTIEQPAIEHPGSVVLVPLQKQKEEWWVLMLQQYRHALDQTILELPAGTRKWGEPWQVCAQRELREETGRRAAQFIDLGEIWPAPGITDERMQLVLAQTLSLDPLPADKDEQIEVVPMLLADVFALAQNGRLQDAKSIIGIWRAAQYLQII